ncbi:unnamed protein product [Linum trigynum]|uniref:Uncharacterized protein n=1 Tax=Linum trigynum TaxID=586398 RepID=A0AAV2D170_9ROSI
MWRSVTTKKTRGPRCFGTKRLRACHLEVWSCQAPGRQGPGAATCRCPTVGPYQAFNDALTWSWIPGAWLEPRRV